ncbi:MAG: hypothetical protein KDD82_21900 [Planctomycetes bacterium]|nr:hypothetical protein [Planctomycetota bacterium]
MNDPQARRRTVAREDLVLFINACFACTRQNEFYSDAAGQAVSIGFLHEYILGNYRPLYARTLATGINHFNQAQIVFQLLRSGRETPAEFRAEENALIRAALAGLPPQRVYRLFTRLRRARVNNRRARATIRDYLASRPDPAFHAIKYRSKLNAASAHAHLKLDVDLRAFLFRPGGDHTYTTPLLRTFREAHYSQKALYELPFTVAEGLAQKHEIPREVFLKKIEPRLTQAERLRLQQAAQRSKGVNVEVDLTRAPLTKLALYLLSRPLAEREARREEYGEALVAAAGRALRRAPARLGKVAAILDRSYSASGSSEKRRRPLGVALAASTLLRRAARDYRALWTPACSDELLVQPGGQTNLADPLLDALEWGAELIVIVSDGFENDPPGAVAQLLAAYRRFLDPERAVSVIHVNPVFDARNYEPRVLGAGIPTVGVRDAEDLPTMLGFARFVDGSAELPELEAYLQARVRGFVGGGA